MSEISVTVRKAVPDDIPAIHEILSVYARRGIVLERSPEDLAFYLKNFTIAEADGRIVGCVAVRDFGNDLLEVRSLAVREACHGMGVGRKLVEAARSRLAGERAAFRLFALTLTPEFFRRLGFTVVPKELFPEKIWHDCSRCPKRDRCDETAVIFRHPETPQP